mgnify:CR=1 FL=1
MENRKHPPSASTGAFAHSLRAMLFLFPFLFGLYYEFSLFLAGVCLCVWLLCFFRKHQSLRIPRTIPALCLAVLLLCYAGSCFYAVDQGLASTGVLRLLPVVLFFIAWNQLEPTEQSSCRAALPYTGTAMTLIAVPAYLFPACRNFFYRADRLGGFFQYSNAFALFLLLGVVLTASRDTVQKRELALSTVLLAGILLTGSRGVFLLTLLALAVLFVRKKALRRPILIALACILICGVAFVSITGSFQNIGRFLTISGQSSTLWGRLLYDLDGLSLLRSQPFGLGYLGYAYIQPQIQSGVYSARFIHNDYLQTALDAGLLAGIAFAALPLYGLFSRRTGRAERLCLLLMALYFLFDLGIEFSYLFFVLLLLLPQGSVWTIRRLPPLRVCTVALGCLLLYGSVAFGMEYAGNFAAAVRLYPGNTSARESLMQQAKNPDDAEALAEEILARNRYSVAAWDMKALTAAVRRDYEAMVDYKQQTLSIARYSVSEYEDYIFLLKRAIEFYQETGDVTSKETYVELALRVPDQLAALRAQTSPLAFQLRDQPQFELSKEVQDYLKSLETGG